MNPLEAVLQLEAPLLVRPAQPDDRAGWDGFVEQCPQATFFHRWGWREILQGVLRHRAHYLLAERAGAIVGVLPLAEVRSVLFGHSLVSLPFAVYGGAAVSDVAARAPLHAAAVALAQRLGVDHLELRNIESHEPQWAQQDLYVRFARRLEPEVEANLMAIPRKQRAMVRKGIGRGLRSEIDRSPDRFYALYSDNQQRHGTPALSREYFEALQYVFGPAVELLTVVSAERVPVSSVLSFYFRDQVLPYYAGDLPDARDLAANDFKYWELMRRACERGCTVFDYGRSKRDTGSYAFKKNWGFEPHQLHYEFKLLRRDTLPQNNPANPKYRAFIAVWRKLPRPLANALGPIVVRNLG